MSALQGSTGSQGSADPPSRIEGDARDEGKATKTKDGARDPAPGEADPLSAPEARPGDKRRRWDA